MHEPGLKRSELALYRVCQWLLCMAKMPLQHKRFKAYTAWHVQSLIDVGISYLSVNDRFKVDWLLTPPFAKFINVDLPQELSVEPDSYDSDWLIVLMWLLQVLIIAELRDTSLAGLAPSSRSCGASASPLRSNRLRTCWLTSNQRLGCPTGSRQDGLVTYLTCY